MTPEAAADAPDRRQLQQIIAGVTEGVILVEPDGRIVYANEAALQMHGALSTAEIGATTAEYAELFTLRYRDGGTVPPGEHHFARLLRGESFDGLVFEVRQTADAEADWIHRVRGFVLEDAAGEPDVLVLVLDDATDAFEAEERFERMFNANPAPALIVRVADLRYVRVNQGFLEMTGHQADEIVGRSIYELDVLVSVEEREIQAARVADWKTVPQMEAELPLPGGGSKLVIVAGHPIEIADAQCMLFTFADLEPRRRAERALQQSEERFAKAFRLAPAPMLIASLDGFRLLNVNHAFVQLTGWALEEIVGRAPADIELWAGGGEVERRLREGAPVRDLPVQLRTKTGGIVDASVSAESADLRGERSVLMVLQDVTERRRSEAELAEAIEGALRDTDWLSRKVLDRLARMRRGADTRPEHVELSPREREVLALVAQGRGDAEIGEVLSLSRNTVRNHLARTYAKIGVHSRAEAVVWARERNLNSTANGS